MGNSKKNRHHRTSLIVVRAMVTHNDNDNDGPQLTIKEKQNKKNEIKSMVVNINR